MKETVPKRRSVNTFFSARDERRRTTRPAARASLAFSPALFLSPLRRFSERRLRARRAGAAIARGLAPRDDRALEHRRLLQEPRGEPADVLAAKDDDGGGGAAARGPEAARARRVDRIVEASFRRTAGEEARRSSERPPSVAGAPSFLRVARVLSVLPLRVSSEVPSVEVGSARRRLAAVDPSIVALARSIVRVVVVARKRTGRTDRRLLPPPLASVARRARTLVRVLFPWKVGDRLRASVLERGSVVRPRRVFLARERP